MNPTRYVDLYGRVRKITYKNDNIIDFVFNDDSFGDIHCKAGRETILYRKVDRSQRYHLQVVLKGISRASKRGGDTLYNNVYVRKVFNLPVEGVRV